jgi:hypothetical protein
MSSISDIIMELRQLTDYVNSMRLVTVRDSTKLHEFAPADIGSSTSMVGQHGVPCWKTGANSRDFATQSWELRYSCTTIS